MLALISAPSGGSKDPEPWASAVRRYIETAAGDGGGEGERGEGSTLETDSGDGDEASFVVVLGGSTEEWEAVVVAGEAFGGGDGGCRVVALGNIALVE